MKVEIEKLAKSELKLIIEVSEEELQKYKAEATQELSKHVKVPGFREGHVPFEVLVKQVGEKAFRGQMLEMALGETYEKALKQEKVAAVSYPKINVVSETPFKYEAIVAVLPEVTIKKGHEKVSHKSKEVKIEKKEVEEVLKNLRKRSTTWKEVERAAKKGDRVELDFEGYDMDGKELEGTSSKNHPVVLGENMFIPGFEEEVVGLKKGEEKDFEITFPKDYHSEAFKNKKVKFHVKVGMVEESTEREMDDAFAEELTGGKHKKLSDLEDEIKKELTHQKEHDEEIRMENEILEELMKYFDAEIPDALIERETEMLIERLKREIEKSGMKWEDYEAMKEKDGKSVREELKPQAEKQVLMRLGIEKLYEIENIKVTEDDLEEEIKHMLAHYPEDYASKVHDYYKPGTQGREQLENQLMLKKLMKKFKA
jgi:trigger factor